MMNLKDNTVTIPEELCCPITCDIMRDPVVLEDGHTYEKTAIECWLKEHNTSPKTNLTLKTKVFAPNIGLKYSIETFIIKANADFDKKALAVAQQASTHAAEKNQRLEDKGFKTAAGLLAEEADGLALESTLRYSQVEYERDQLFDWNKLNEAQKAELKGQLGEQTAHAAQLRWQLHQLKCTPDKKRLLQKNLKSIDSKLIQAPRNMKFINTKATLLRDLNKPLEALVILNDALKQVPGNTYILNTRGNIFKELGRLDAALQDFETIIQIQPDNKHALTGKKSILRMLGREEEAIQCQKRLEQINFASQTSTKLSGHAVAEQKSQSSFSSQRSQAQGRRKPQDDVKSSSSKQWYTEIRELTDAAKALKQQGDYAAALPLLNQALDKAPKNTYVLNSRGDIYAKLGLQDKALADYNAALKLKPNDRYAVAGRRALLEKTQAAASELTTSLSNKLAFFQPAQEASERQASNNNPMLTLAYK